MRIHFQGNHHDLEDLKADLAARFGEDQFEIKQNPQARPFRLGGDDLGQMEMADILIQFGIGFGSQILASAVTELVAEFRKRRPSAKVKVEPAGDPTDGGK